MKKIWLDFVCGQTWGYHFAMPCKAYFVVLATQTQTITHFKHAEKSLASVQFIQKVLNSTKTCPYM